ncbi:MAG TPA: cold shock domain-containing protein [Aromatoleum sp.]|uniref:cold shock domain-containing protein n=1 Tax=Aromatoleum sp. TaxID=2307007 RepID=UPI002B48F5F9|nr:cold shock domain-containing protein [Aromatoleum sp.]HJV25640.1 cold shock domain-containing protein [Aromatoleum sp.]
MRIDGTLGKWNDDRGFGFISPTNGGPEVFAHISAFPRDGRRPQIGEALSFEIGFDKEGKKRAVNITRPGAPRNAPVRPRPQARPAARPSWFSSIGRLLVVGALAVYGYKAIQPRLTQSPSPVELSDESSVPAKESPAPPFHCDGRTYCSQMTSCAEATFFLKNCPDVKMDGNHDGVPCEQQWCTGLFAR